MMALGPGRIMQYIKYASLCIPLFLLFLLQFTLLPAEAQDSYQDFERGLNLSDTQKDQVQGIRKRYMEEWSTLRRESARKRLELQEVDRGSEAGRERARRLESDLNSNRSSRENLYRRYRGEVSGVLNEQQRGRYERFSNGERGGMMPPPHSRGMMPPPRYRGHGR
jgi:Spy/CpxP family protein refolding chaperone